MDLTPYLAPISAETPSGIDMSFSPEFDAIEEKRREDDPSLDQGEWVSELKTADWAGVARDCEQLLAHRSKDLRLAGRLADAWARLRGFDGLADGLELVSRLVDAHWDTIHPLAEGGDQEERIGNLRWLAARIDHLAPILALVVHAGRSARLVDIAAARALRLAAKDAPSYGQPEVQDDSVLTLEKVWRDVTGAGREALARRRAEVARARAALAAMQASVDARLGEDAPSFVGPRKALESVQDELVRLERECGFSAAVAVEEAVPAQAAAGEAVAAQAQGAPRVPGRIDSRAQAIEQLRQVAAYFHRTEPHSPAAYLADKAVRWAEMPLHDWLRTVVKDGGALAHLEELLGIDKPAGG